MDLRDRRSKYEDGRRKPVIPARDRSAPEPTPPAPAPFRHPVDHVDVPRDLAGERERLGFDDIPIGVEDVSFKQIASAWFKRGFKHSELEGKGTKLSTLVKEKSTGWKDDLKWAMAADLEEDEIHPTQPKAPPHASATALHSQTGAAQLHAPAAQPATKNVDININFGSLPQLPKLPVKKILATLRHIAQRLHLSRRNLLIGGTLLLIVGGGVIGYQYLKPKSYYTLADGKKVAVDDPSLKNKLPQYTTVTPSGKDVRELGGWARVSPPGKNPVFAYADKIGAIPISVSQQPLPENFKSHTSDKIAELAKSYIATDKQTASGTDFYVGTSAKGPQSVITSKHNLLILIKSTSKIDDKQWAEYISSLK